MRIYMFLLCVFLRTNFQETTKVMIFPICATEMDEFQQIITFDFHFIYGLFANNKFYVWLLSVMFMCVRTYPKWHYNFGDVDSFGSQPRTHHNHVTNICFAV